MVLSCFCFWVLKCRKTLRERRGSKMLSEGGEKKTSCECYLEGKMWNWILISFLFLRRMSLPMKYEACERQNVPKSLFGTVPNFHMWGVFLMWLIEQIVTDSENSGAPFSPLTNLSLPITYHLSFILHSINIVVIPTICQLQHDVVKLKTILRKTDTFPCVLELTI